MGGVKVVSSEENGEFKVRTELTAILVQNQHKKGKSRRRSLVEGLMKWLPSPFHPNTCRKRHPAALLHFQALPLLLSV